MENSNRIKELIEQLNEYNYQYYTLDNPIISDKQYDEIYDELVLLEKQSNNIMDNSPTQRVGGEILDHFEKHKHLSQLYSLGKAQSFSEIIEWNEKAQKIILDYNKINDEKLPEIEYVLEYKFDGLTLNLTYDNGKLIQGSTRGNGEIGEGILSQIKTIKSIPLSIPYKGKLEIQGEGLMPLSALEKYNEVNEDILKNARNAVAGALRNLDTSITANRNLVAYFYNIGYSEENLYGTHIEMMDFIKEQRLPKHPYLNRFDNIDSLIEEIENQGELRKELDILTDGMVIKINDLKTREILGYTQKFPRWAIAYKFKAEEMTTKLIGINWNVGRTGKITPTASLEAVEIGGVTVQKATLNNWDDIQRKKVKINSMVWIRRSNDVIPEIMGVVEGTEFDGIDIEMPTECPACGGELIREGVHLFCHNSLSCEPQLVNRMAHFGSRDAMNIEGFSEKTALQLYKQLGLHKISDLYYLKADDLVGLEGFKEKKINNLLNSIDKSKNCSLGNFLFALGISNVGKKTARDIADCYKTIEELKLVTEEELLEIPDVGPVVARELVEYFNDDLILDQIENLIKAGVNPIQAVLEIKENPFTSKTIVITGTMLKYKRNELKEMILQFGGKVSSSISSKTNYLLIGENPGSKFEKAKALGVEIINEETFEKMIKID